MWFLATKIDFSNGVTTILLNTRYPSQYECFYNKGYMDQSMKGAGYASFFRKNYNVSISASKFPAMLALTFRQGLHASHAGPETPWRHVSRVRRLHGCASKAGDSGHPRSEIPVLGPLSLETLVFQGRRLQG
jgi:hypothetical protein